MAGKEHEPSIIEKGAWWAKVGGAVAGIIGILRHSAELTLGGAGVAAAGLAIEGIVYNSRQKHVSSKA